MSICGVITTKEVLRHGGTIVREFGARSQPRLEHRPKKRLAKSVDRTSP